MTLRTWDNDKRCAECCNGDRCDDPTHYSRAHCPHCRGTGWAIWTEAGSADYLKYLTTCRGYSQEDAEKQLSELKAERAG